MSTRDGRRRRAGNHRSEVAKIHLTSVKGYGVTSGFGLDDGSGVWELELGSQNPT